MDEGLTILVGGSFDPPHLGHLGMGLAVRDNLPSVSRVIYLPAPQPPHKSGLVASFSDRFKMTKLLVAGHDRLEASDVESSLPPPHVTVKTLEYIKSGNVFGDNLALLIGADSYCDIHKWYDYRRLFDLARIVVVNRDGYSMVNVNITDDLASRVIHIGDLRMRIASRDLRPLLATGERPPEITDSVMAYISSNGLYQNLAT